MTRTTEHDSARVVFETDGSRAGDTISGPGQDAYLVPRVQPRQRKAHLCIEELIPGRLPASVRHGTYVPVSNAAVTVDGDGLDRAEKMLLPLVRMYCDLLYSSLDPSDTLNALSSITTAMRRSEWIPSRALWAELFAQKLFFRYFEAT